MRCLSPITIVSKYSENQKQTVYSTKRNGNQSTEDGYLVSCGQCIACKINRARTWSLRITHETSNHSQSMFLTLTYNNKHLPSDLSISKRELQLFIKRLRKHISSRYNSKIRYFACGEYGQPTDYESKHNLSKIGRPHYHLLIFGFVPNDLTYLRRKGGYDYYSSPTIEKVWGKGYIVIGTVTPESAQYVAGYCTKKITGTQEEEHYTRIHPDTGAVCHCLPEFQTCSQGLGGNFVDDYAGDMRKGFLTYENKSFGIPRYYLKRLQKKLDSLKEQLKNAYQAHVHFPSMLILFAIQDIKTEMGKLVLLMDDIQSARQAPDSFDVLPDFEKLHYSYDVAKVYQERSRERQTLKDI